jgi:hypothetical protein
VMGCPRPLANAHFTRLRHPGVYDSGHARKGSPI